jgi:hypothetical protein
MAYHGVEVWVNQGSGVFTSSQYIDDYTALQERRHCFVAQLVGPVAILVSCPALVWLAGLKAMLECVQDLALQLVVKADRWC